MEVRSSLQRPPYFCFQKPKPFEEIKGFLEELKRKEESSEEGISGFPNGGAGERERDSSNWNVYVCVLNHASYV